MLKYIPSLAVCVLVLSGILNFAFQSQASGDSSAAFDKLVDEYFDFQFRFHPTAGTAAGFHQYDTQLEDSSVASRDAEAAGLNKLLAKFAAVDKGKLSPDAAADLEVIQADANSRLLELHDLRMWEKDPDIYTSGATYAVFIIIKRNFASQEERLKSVIARERQIPRNLETARKNLHNPPRIYTEVALQQLPGVAEYFKNDVAAAFPEVKDEKLLAEFKSANAATIDSIQRYENFLKNELLPASKGDFRIGAENFRKKLLYEEMVDIPLDRLAEIGYADLHRNQQRLKEVAAQIDPQHSPREVLQQLEKDHPPADQLLQTFRDTLGGLRQFIQEKKIITIPSQVLPIVEETPPFARALTTASMDTPGAYETVAKEAMFNVTIAEPDWKPERVEEWMEGFNRGTIISTAVHEVYPGHYTQFLWVQAAPSKTRKLLYCGTNAEGWAHYTEQMMLDEGYGNGDPRLRVGQLQDALLRDARFIAGIEMHTGKITMDQAKKFFVDEGYQTPPVADVESKRGTSDPTYLVYTLGKLQILKLREDYRKKMGDRFKLQDFHDEFMRQGGIPLELIRKAMLGDDSPTL